MKLSHFVSSNINFCKAFCKTYSLGSFQKDLNFESRFVSDFKNVSINVGGVAEWFRCSVSNLVGLNIVGLSPTMGNTNYKPTALLRLVNEY